MPSMAAETGGTALCLFEVPEVETGKRKLINLAIVQHVELTRDEFKIVYGGGALGSGYEVRIPLTRPDEGRDYLERMRKTAAQCR